MNLQKGREAPTAYVLEPAQSRSAALPSPKKVAKINCDPRKKIQTFFGIQAVSQDALQVASLLERSSAGDVSAASELEGVLYQELYRIATRLMARERPDHTLQATILVHDAYMQLLGQRNVSAAARTHFLAAAAKSMRRMLVDHARAKRAAKRGGRDAVRLPLREFESPHANSFDMLSLHEALSALALQSERSARVVELKFFGGMTIDEIAQELNISPRMVNLEWRFAKAWLYRRLADETPEGR